MLRTLRAEGAKLWTLPAVVFAVAGTVAVGVLLAAAMGKLALDDGGDFSASAVVLQIVAFVQAGIVVLGILPVAQEYAGRQISTTLVAMPRRGELLLAKGVATLAALTITMLATLGAAWGTAAIMLGELGEIWPLVGAAFYGILIGMLSFAAALAIRQATGVLVGMLVLLYLLPPLLQTLGEHLRWLPGVAGRELYAPMDPVLTAGTGALIVAGWIVVSGAVGSIRFLRADA